MLYERYPIKKMHILIWTLILGFWTASLAASEPWQVVLVSWRVDKAEPAIRDVINADRTDPEFVARYGDIFLAGWKSGSRVSAPLVVETLSRAGADLGKMIVRVEDPSETVAKTAVQKPPPPPAPEPAAPAAIEEPKVSIRKGDIVTIAARNKRLQIRALGRVREVLENGALVSVENLDSKKTVLGKPIGPGEVEIVF